ncbi:MAG: hypothetical protein Hyperionvirus6_79 [Hyperionvirus sp.]|uniref:Uncharacterized protein n=1 Tax=Hyperionvirus sp. TaxID=2487770 RepID=A0A3G5A873_9VIRU|nr:MAG: hypothetical protein Hyperionvirus6_79 [Hyperionvirus sp.]
MSAHGPSPIKSTKKVDLEKLSPLEICQRLFLLLKKPNYCKYVDIKHFLLANPIGSKISFHAVPLGQMQIIGNFLCMHGFLDLFIHFDKYLTLDRPYRYELLDCAALCQRLDTVHYLLSQNTYPSKADGIRKENISEDKNYLQELKTYGEIIVTCSRKMIGENMKLVFSPKLITNTDEANRRVKCCLTLINADPRCVLDRKENISMIRENAAFNDLVEIVERTFQIEFDSGAFPDDELLKDFFECVAEYKAKKVFQFLIEKVIAIINRNFPDKNLIRTYFMTALYHLVTGDHIEMFSLFFPYAFHTIESQYGSPESKDFFNSTFDHANVSNAVHIMNYLLRFISTKPFEEFTLVKTIEDIVPDEKKNIDTINLIKLSLLLIHNRLPIKLNSHYQDNYFHPTINFDRCYPLSRIGANLSLIKGFDLTILENNKKEFRQTIITIVIEKGNITITETAHAHGLYTIIESYLFYYVPDPVANDDDSTPV